MLFLWMGAWDLDMKEKSKKTKVANMSEMSK